MGETAEVIADSRFARVLKSVGIVPTSSLIPEGDQLKELLKMEGRSSNTDSMKSDVGESKGLKQGGDENKQLDENPREFDALFLGDRYKENFIQPMTLDENDEGINTLLQRLQYWYDERYLMGTGQVLPESLLPHETGGPTMTEAKVVRSDTQDNTVVIIGKTDDRLNRQLREAAELRKRKHIPDWFDIPLVRATGIGTALRQFYEGLALLGEDEEEQAHEATSPITTENIPPSGNALRTNAMLAVIEREAIRMTIGRDEKEVEARQWRRERAASFALAQEVAAAAAAVVEEEGSPAATSDPGNVSAKEGEALVESPEPVELSPPSPMEVYQENGPSCDLLDQDGRKRILWILGAPPDTIPAEARAAALVDLCEEVFSGTTLLCKHVGVLMEFFPFGDLPKALGFGSYRLELLITLLPRVSDRYIYSHTQTHTHMYTCIGNSWLISFININNFCAGPLHLPLLCICLLLNA